MTHSPSITVHRVSGGIEHRLAVDDTTHLVYVRRAPAHEKPEQIVLRFGGAGHWRYQHLLWMCRAGKPSLYAGLTALYGYLRRGRLTERSLRWLAGGEAKREPRDAGSPAHWARKDGWAVGTKAFGQARDAARQFQEASRSARAIERAVDDFLAALPYGDAWAVQRSPGRWWIVERPSAAGSMRAFSVVNAGMGAVLVQESLGATPPEWARKRDEESERRSPTLYGVVSGPWQRLMTGRSGPADVPRMLDRIAQAVSGAHQLAAA